MNGDLAEKKSSLAADWELVAKRSRCQSSEWEEREKSRADHPPAEHHDDGEKSAQRTPQVSKGSEQLGVQPQVDRFGAVSV